MLHDILTGAIAEEIDLGFEANCDAMDFVVANDCFNLVLRYKFEKGTGTAVREFLFPAIYRYFYYREKFGISRVQPGSSGRIRQLRPSRDVLDQFFAEAPLGGAPVYVYLADVTGAGLLIIFSAKPVVEQSAAMVKEIDFF